MFYGVRTERPCQSLGTRSADSRDKPARTPGVPTEIPSVTERPENDCATQSVGMSRSRGRKMKIILVLCGVIALVSGIAWQLSAGTSARSPSGTLPSGLEPIPVQSEPPPCPELETCADLGCPGPSNNCNTVDTGENSCTLSDGTIFSYNGNKTVHQKHCRCVNQPGPSGCFSTRDSEPIFCQ